MPSFPAWSLQVQGLLLKFRSRPARRGRPRPALSAALERTPCSTQPRTAHSGCCSGSQAPGPRHWQLAYPGPPTVTRTRTHRARPSTGLATFQVPPSGSGWPGLPEFQFGRWLVTLESYLGGARARYCDGGPGLPASDRSTWPGPTLPDPSVQPASDC